ncbi:MAG: hypothetical protein CMB76_03715 [Euryarchaeota archaeon]|nr:hypothetical protein [Euryarchaeota archaeon]|tara:strand:- start:12488 stop:13825 length:1338 start_codon:yes stop_codon:yes gene_type:complete
MPPLAGSGGPMSEEPEVQFEQIGIFQLIKNMLSPRTLPHIIMIALISTLLLFLVDSQEVLVAMSFISLAISYVLIAVLSNSNLIQILTKLPEQKGDSHWFVRLLFSFRITIVPILIAGIIVGILWSFTGGYDNGWISPLLASLFIVWSIAQAASFRAGMVEWLANGLGDAKLHTYQEKISTASQVVVVQVFALVILWLGQIISQTEKMTLQDALLGGVAFIVISIILQVTTLWLTRDEREASGNEKGMAAFSFKWMIVAQLFITWHAFSVYRRTAMNPSDISTIIEEGLLMAFTVIFAVWSLTTYTVRDGKRLISQNASLPLGISFGYAYAGSVALLTGTFDNLTEVLIFGHVLSIGAMMLLLRPTLRTSRMTSEMFLNAKSVDITKTDEQKEEEVPEDDGSDSQEETDEEWQEDQEIDWEKGIDISEDTEWEDDDVELAESDEA